MTVAYVKNFAPGSSISFIWEGLTVAEGDGQVLTLPSISDRSVQVIGTFDSNTITIQGSNSLDPDTAIWNTLHNKIGDELTFTAAGIDDIAEQVYHIRPVNSGGTTIDIDVLLFGRSS